MTIAQQKVVTIHYKVVDVDSGEVIDSSEGGQPMTYLHGAQNIIPGLEQALEGKQAGFFSRDKGQGLNKGYLFPASIYSHLDVGLLSIIPHF